MPVRKSLAHHFNSLRSTFLMRKYHLKVFLKFILCFWPVSETVDSMALYPRHLQQKTARKQRTFFLVLRSVKK